MKFSSDICTKNLKKLLKKRGIPEKYVNIVKETYRETRTRVRSTVVVTKNFEVTVFLHKGTALSLFLFNVLFNVQTET